MSTMQVGGVEFDITVDASGVATAKTRAVEDLTKLQKAFKDTDVSAGKANAAMKKSGSSFQSMGKSAGAAGIQIQQLVGQIQGGQNVFNALSAQAADLGIVLGAPLVGAVAGLGAAFAGILLPSLFDTEDKTQDLIDKLRELAEIQVLSAEEAKLLAQEEKNKKNEIYGTIQATEKQIAADKKALKSEQDRLTLIGQTQWARSRIGKNIRELNQSIVEEEAKLKDLNNQYEKSREALDLYNSMVDGSIEQTNKQAEEVNALVSAFEAQADAIGKTDRQLAVKAATEKGATETQLEAINTAFDAIEAEEARAEAVVEARKKAAQAIKDEIQAQKNYEALLDEIAANQKKKDQEKQQEKEGIGSNLDRIREDLMSEQQLRAEAFLTQGEQLREALDAQLVTKQEYDALEKERVAQHQQWLIDKTAQTTAERTAIEKRHQDTVSNFRNSAIQNAIGLLDMFAGESKAAALASIILSKGLALAQNTQNTLVAQTRALAELGPIAGPPMAATIGAYGAANAALIAATGLAQGASVLSGKSSALTSSGGVPAVNTTSNAGQSSVPQEAQRNISIAVTGGYGSMDDMARALVPALNEALGDGYNFKVNGG